MTLSYLVGRRNYQNSPWTAERDALLAQLWAEGWSAAQIAGKIMDTRISRCAVIGRAHRLKLQPRKMRHPPKIKRANGVPKPPTPPPRPQPRPQPSPEPPPLQGLSFLELGPMQCHFPFGDGPFVFCGAEAAGVYCEFHQRMSRRAE